MKGFTHEEPTSASDFLCEATQRSRCCCGIGHIGLHPAASTLQVADRSRQLEDVRRGTLRRVIQREKPTQGLSFFASQELQAL